MQCVLGFFQIQAVKSPFSPSTLSAVFLFLEEGESFEMARKLPKHELFGHGENKGKSFSGKWCDGAAILGLGGGVGGTKRRRGALGKNTCGQKVLNVAIYIRRIRSVP